MNALRASNIIAFRTATKALATEPRRSAGVPVLRAVWRVAPDTGRLECTWTDAAAASEPYSRAA